MNSTKMRLTSFVFVFVLFVYFVGCTPAHERPASNMAAVREAKREINDLRDAIKKVEPFFSPMKEPEPDDWLASHNEPGQTFEEYLESEPIRPKQERQKLYVLPLGKFTPQQQKVIDATAGYLEVFYDLPMVEMPAKPFTATWPHIRQNRFTKTRQIKTGHILNDVLKPLLPTDAFALIAFTADDLFPSESMNFVFGQARFDDRVGVWSLARLDDNANYDRFLQRTLKIAAHETGHMFSMRHCTKYECLMSGTNHLGETDRRPIDACPECMAKICWLSDITPTERYRKLADFCRKNGLTAEANDFDRKARAVE
jgi:archaemetzincin